MDDGPRGTTANETNEAIGRGQAEAAGRGSLVATRPDARMASTLSHAFATSPLRFVRPTFPGSSAAAVCLVTFGGGLVDGDTVDLDVTVDPGATLLVFTQATTKVFRGRARQSLRARVAGTLVLLPDPVACFRDAHYTQHVDVDLQGPSASCVVLDGFTSGRAAYGERWAFGSLETRTVVRRDGKKLLHEAFRLDAKDGSIAERMDRFEAFATLFAIGPGVAPVRAGILSHSREHARGADGALVAAPSPLPVPRRDSTSDGAIVRIAGTTPLGVIDEVQRRLRNLPEIDVVDPFTARH
ncbi:Urease accessory protein UreD [Labilithrix luteola]|uniref:Urease accessory protein UreD n=1 Tax=Labilithrix luteola TaxID=1391654 RepID=A0A0K1Q995_9BACT|nr:urease accessory protein UreD [Labilithrix luteola]AKV02366.1 Urease accessory protein UreD [Labilithrix luteola]